MEGAETKLAGAKEAELEPEQGAQGAKPVKAAKKKFWTPGVVALTVVCALIVAAWFWLLERQIPQDWVASWGYAPTEEVAELEEALDLTWRGQLIWAAVNPTLEEAEAFNEYCDSHDAEVSVLGCYAPSEDKVYIYLITDETLKDANKSTAAHELLHAAWDRMTELEQVEVRGWLDELYESDREWFDEELSTYEDDEWTEEMYTRAATKRRELPAELEEHYGKYFEDRAQVVQYYENYQEPLNELNAELDERWAELDELDVAIEEERAEYIAAVDEYNGRVERFNICADTPGCFNETTFAWQRQQLTAEGDELDAWQEALNGRIRDYNQKLAEYNEKEAVLQGLYNRMNSSEAGEAVEEV